jgi:hypothetical protein
MITEGNNLAKVKKISGKTVEIITTDDDNQLSVWFCEFSEKVPEVGKLIVIEHFRMTSAKTNDKRYPVKIYIDSWEYYKKA